MTMIAMLLNFKGSLYSVAEVLRAYFEFWHWAGVLGWLYWLLGQFFTQPWQPGEKRMRSLQDLADLIKQIFYFIVLVLQLQTCW